MAYSTAVADLYTTVRNISSKSLNFSYLGLRGKTLANLAEYTVFGHIQHRLGTEYGGHPVKRRSDALERDLIAGRIAIKSTPRPLYYDASPLAALANPTTAVTAASSVASGGLAAGTYFACYTWVSATGETTAGTSEIASAFTSTGTSQLWTLTIPAKPTNAVSANIYLTAAGGASGTEVLYRTGVTTTTVALNTVPATSTVTPPTTNTSAGHSVRGETITAGVLGQSDPSWGYLLN